MIAALIGEMQATDALLILLALAGGLAAALYVKVAFDRAPSDVERTYAEWDALDAAIVADRAARTEAGL